MSNNLFAAPAWDVDVPDNKFKFNKQKKRQKSKEKHISTQNIKDNEPGKYVRINKTVPITLINEKPLKSKKRKISQDHNDEGGRAGGGGISTSRSKKRKPVNHNNAEAEDSNLLDNKGFKLKTTKVTSQFADRNVSKKIRKNVEKSNGKNEYNQPGRERNGNVNKTKQTVDINEGKVITNRPNSFREKLIGNLKGSRFRFLNEMLYTSDGKNAAAVFGDDSEAFTAYHEGYRQQVQQWPLNPLDKIIKAIHKLPKSYTIADFGCGEGRLARSVPHKTYSLDLVAAHGDVIAGDMANTPLETNSINVAVFCLSLMGTNLKDFLLEANRVLKIGGLVKIAEVESRFTDLRQFIENVKWCGFELLNKDLSNNLFYFINFKKIRNVVKNNQKVPAFSLKPCLYKKR